MLICIPTNGSGGMNEGLSEHFGSAPYFTLYDSDSGEIHAVENRNTDHIHGTCHPLTNLGKFNIDAMVCAGIGRRAIEMLKIGGITVYQSDKETVAEVVEQVKNNQLTEIDPAKACMGHGHRQRSFNDGTSQGCRHGKQAR